MHKLIRGRRHAQRAAWLEILSKDYAAAMVEYNSAILHLEESLESILRRIRRYGERLSALRQIIPSPNQWGDVHVPVVMSTTTEKRYICEMEGLFVLGSPTGRCVDVDAPDVVQLVAQLLRRKKEPASSEPSRSVLLSGPAATGKCCLVRALSLGIRSSTVYYVYLPQFLPRRSAYEVGVIIRSLFVGNDERRPVILVVDHVDQLCKPPVTGAAKAFTRLLERLMNHKPLGVRLVALTDIPWDLSPRLQAVFERRVYVPLPNYMSRIQIANHLLSGTDGYISDISLEELAASTKGFTSSEVAMCLRSTFWSAALRETELSCCVEVDDSPQARKSPTPTDKGIREAIAIMSASLKKNPRARNPLIPISRLKSLSNLVQCNIS
ncbi:vacuolar protein sorting-associated protein 4A-like [Ornithodoros turicata]|uniref:vacuolar protein sorting-associated protein 4A-like n=1 Tax=Ornithodoros turicata TaxID=34597 RepID=UPI003138EADA